MRRDFNNAVSNARRRGIGWTLTFDQWRDIWLRSGKYAERGRRCGEYQMDRIENTGIYEPGNVQIVDGAVNRTKDAPHGHVAMLDEEAVRSIRTTFKPRVVTRRHLAARFGVTVACIKAVLSGRNWKAA